MTIHAGDNPLAGSSNQTVANITCTVADFEYSYTLPLNTRKFSIKTRQTGSTIKLAYESGQSGSNYLTIGCGGYWEDLVGFMNQTLYFQSPTAGTIVEIVAGN